jgi:membrane fusion protein, heavy metal efflux system
MNTRLPKLAVKWIPLSVLLLVIVVGGLTRGRWFPALKGWVAETAGNVAAGSDPSTDAGTDAHDGHDHADHDEGTSLELSPQALRNVGLSDDTIKPIELTTFRRSITVPALVVERPGRTRVQVATPMTGVITHVHAVQGEAVEPGALLFQIRLTHEDLVQAQTEFLRILGELDVEFREITRLEDITKSGAVAGKMLLERQYARDKLSALLDAQREALRLHGLSDSQLDKISSERRLLRELQIFAPSIDDHDDSEMKLSRNAFRPVVRSNRQDEVSQSAPAHVVPLILQNLDVHKGQSVTAGETLCILTDYDDLFIEGMAFEQDISQLRRASEEGWTVEALFEEPGSKYRVVSNLEFAYLANQIDASSRTLPFYIRLPNTITKDKRSEGNRYIEWEYLPGQRVQLRVPVEEWDERIVLPVDAVAQEGAEFFVFQQNGDHFDRRPVYVEYQDQMWVVIANDGSLFPGDVVAMTGAHMMQVALKNKAGGGVDPHAGHNH